MTADVERLKKIAESGDSEAQFQLALYYQLQEDYKDCIRWFKAACENKHVFAMTNLAICYYFGDHIEQSYEKAWPLFLQASIHGDVTAKYYVGLSYLNGNGIDQDSSKAFKILFDCASIGMPWAQLSLADCYVNGTGTEIDLYEAVSWYARAAHQDIEEAGEKFNSIYYSTDFTDTEGNQRWFWFEEDTLTDSC